jgi:hypothetical protein
LALAVVLGKLAAAHYEHMGLDERLVLPLRAAAGGPGSVADNSLAAGRFVARVRSAGRLRHTFPSLERGKRAATGTESLARWIRSSAWARVE